MKRLNWGTPVIFVNPKTGLEQEGYYATNDRHPDYIVTIGADGKGDYPHYRVDTIKWRPQYEFPHNWFVPASNVITADFSKVQPARSQSTIASDNIHATAAERLMFDAYIYQRQEELTQRIKDTCQAFQTIHNNIKSDLAGPKLQRFNPDF